MPAKRARVKGLYQRAQTTAYWSDPEEIAAIEEAAKRAGKTLGRFASEATVQVARRENAKSAKSADRRAIA